MREVYRRVTAPLAALTIAIGGTTVAKAAEGPALGPATTQTCEHHEVNSGDVMQCRTSVNGVLRELDTQTTRDSARYTPQGDLIKDHYTLYRVTRYDAFGRRNFHSAACRLIRYVNMERTPVVCQLPPAESNQTIPSPVY